MTKRTTIRLAVAAAAFGLLVPGMFAAPKAIQAMPTFAQATGLKCSACHTMVPLLNAYGRYVQRTAYSAIPRQILTKATPIWIDEALTYDSSQGKQVGTKQWDPGNLAIHGVGYAFPDVTFHVQQWITQGSQSGGLDTFFVAYNNLLHRDGHFSIGKSENIAPSPYSQDSELDGPSASSTLVGEHDWSATNNNRWGAKLAYVHGVIDAEGGWFFSGDDLNGYQDFNPGDKTFQWKVAYASEKRPVEVGVFGSVGTLPVSTGTDHYNSVAGYVQVDPNPKGLPGVLAIYSSGVDDNPGVGISGNPMPETGSKGASVGIYQLFLHGNVLVSVRHDLNDSGPNGQVLNGNSINVGFNAPGWEKIPFLQYVHGYVEANTGATSSWYGANGGPTYKGMIWLALPVSRARE
jgi:hypothetical protein